MQVDLFGHTLTFQTDPALFSSSAPDRGTLAMLSAARIQPDERVLDLGCGWGLVAVIAAKLAGERNVAALDHDERAVALTRENAAQNGVGGIRVILSDGFRNLDESGFDCILCNPPYNADFSVAKHFIEKGFNRLAMGGRMLMVVKRRSWYENKLRAIFGGVTIKEIDGYAVLEAERRTAQYAAKPKEKARNR